MATWCALLMSACVLLLVPSSAVSALFKCYKCLSTSTKEECETNQTLVDCPQKLVCGKLEFVQASGGATFGKTYLKNCLPASLSCAQYNTTGLVQNCSVSICKRDFCNGVPPTTAKPVTSDRGTASTNQSTPHTTARNEERNHASSTLQSSISGFVLSVLPCLLCVILGGR